MTITLLENVEILAVDQKMDAPPDNKVDTKDLRSVTLLVTPQQANQLDLGQNHGMLHLALRNREDNKAAQTKPATPNDLRPPPLPKAPEPHPTGWIIRREVHEGAVLIRRHRLGGEVSHGRRRSTPVAPGRPCRIVISRNARSLPDSPRVRPSG